MTASASDGLVELRGVRRGLGLTQVAVAQAWGRHQSSVARIEAVDLDTVEIGTLAAYAAALGANVTISIERDGDHYTVR